MKIYSKKIVFLLLTTVALFLGACSGDDDGGNGTANYGNFMPLTIGDYWTYDTETTDPQTSTVTQGRDSLYVVSATTIGAFDYMDLDASATSTGFMTTFLAQNTLRTANGKLYAKGNLDFDLSALGGSAHTIAIDDAILVDENATVNTQLYSTSGTITDPVTINGQSVVLTIDYTVKTIQKESFATMDVTGVTFNNVIKANLIISAKIDAQITVQGFPVTLNVAPVQDINVVENYYANGIGLIQSDNNFNINLSATVATQLGIPQNINVPSNQKIDTYLIN